MDKICGVYKIQSIVKPERCYIGSSINLHNRQWQHLNELKRNKHSSSKLQRHVNKYGISDIYFNIIEECKREELLIVEQKYVDIFNPYFNCSKIVNQVYSGKKTKRHVNRVIKAISIPVRQYSLNGELIKKWKSIKAAANGVPLASESRISGICRKLPEFNTAGGFLWAFENDKIKRLPPYIRQKHRYTTIDQYDLDMNFIKNWRSLREAVKSLGFPYSSISDCIGNRRNRKSVRGFIFKTSNFMVY